MAARAVSLASGATASSRSKISASAGKARAFSRARGFDPGMNRTLRRGRIGAGIARFLLGSGLLADISWRDPIAGSPLRHRVIDAILEPTAGRVGPGVSGVVWLLGRACGARRARDCRRLFCEPWRRARR